MQPLEQHRAAAALEQLLGDPLDPASEFSFARAVERDEADAYPEEACRLLDEWGLPAHYVPTDCGGKLGSFEELFALLRVLSRRDLTVTAAHWTTCLAAVSIWLGGTEAQKLRLARRILAGEQVALGLTEREHGSDLLANEVEAVPDARGYRISGEKWLVNNAARGSAVTLFTRTSPLGGPRGYSIFLVEKEGLEPPCRPLPRVRTMGIRGTDISGVRFDGALVPREALVPPAGSGLELTLKSFHVTRALCAALSLGAMDTALRATLAFALTRRLYGDTVFAIPHTRSVLVSAFSDLLRCECVSVAAMRSIHTAPEQMSALSAVVKFLVPTTAENVIQRLSVVLGARHYLREGHWSGIFQKMLRDNAIVSVFDGSTLVNLDGMAAQQRRLAEQWRRESGDASSRVSVTADLDAPLPDFAPERLSLLNRGGDDLLNALPAAARRIRKLADASPDCESLSVVAGQVELLCEVLEEHWIAVEGTPYERLSRTSEAFDLAARYAELYSGAACVHLWLHNRERLGGFLAEGHWLVVCLAQLLARLCPGPDVTEGPFVERLASDLILMYQEGRLFSVAPFPLARPPEN